MRLKLVVVVAVWFVACGLPPPSNTSPPVAMSQVRMRNGYAESLFSVGVQAIDADGGVRGDPVRLFTDERIAGHSFALSEEFPHAYGESLEVSIDATSLGQVHRFQATVPPKSGAKDVLEFLYDYDLATADFTVRFGWTL